MGSINTCKTGDTNMNCYFLLSPSIPPNLIKYLKMSNWTYYNMSV